MANTTKMTKKDYFTALKAVIVDANPANADTLTAFIDHELSLLEKKSTSTKPTKTQTENATVKADILTALAEIGAPVTISEMQAKAPTLATFSNQKLSALMTQLVKEEKVVKTTDKKKSLFSVA